MSEKISFAGEVIVSKLDLISVASKKVANLQSLFLQLEIFEDIFDNTMSGSVYVSDSIGLLTEFPIIGQEYLDVEFRTPTIKNKIKKRFYVYKLTDRVLEGPKRQSYKLHFTSVESIYSLNNIFSKSYMGKRCSEVVKSIYKDPGLIGSDQIIQLEETRNSINFIVPKWNPLQAINWVAQRAVNYSGSPTYMFYEDNQGFNFMALETLAAAVPVASYTYSDTSARAENGSIEESYKRIEALIPERNFDYMKSVATGMLAGNLETFDLITKTYVRKDFDFIKDFSPGLEKNPLYTRSVLRGSGNINPSLVKNNYLYGASKYDPVLYESVMRRNAYIQSLHQFRLQAEVVGRTDIKVGDAIRLTLPTNSHKFDGATTDLDDKLYSGKYLITAIRHVISDNKHSMGLELSRNGYGKKVT